MTKLTVGGKTRSVLYAGALAAGIAALSEYATFDLNTWELDIKPFNVKEFFLTAATTGGNVLAVIAAYFGFKTRTEK